MNEFSCPGTQINEHRANVPQLFPYFQNSCNILLNRIYLGSLIIVLANTNSPAQQRGDSHVLEVLFGEVRKRLHKWTHQINTLCSVSQCKKRKLALWSAHAAAAGGLWALQERNEHSCYNLCFSECLRGVGTHLLNSLEAVSPQFTLSICGEMAPCYSQPQEGQLHHQHRSSMTAPLSSRYLRFLFFHLQVEPWVGNRIN